MRRTIENIQPVEIEHEKDLSSYKEWIEEVEDDLSDPSFSVDTFGKWSFQRPETALQNLESEGFNLLAGELGEDLELTIEEINVPVEVKEYESNLDMMKKTYMAALNSDLHPTHYERKTWINGAENPQIPLRRLEKQEIGFVVCFETEDTYIDMGYLLGPEETSSKFGIEARDRKKNERDSKYFVNSVDKDRAVEDLTYELERQGLELF